MDPGSFIQSVEKEMLRIRVVTVAAMTLMMAGAAAAQSNGTSDAAPGKPISLLRILLKPASKEPAQDEQVAQARSEPAQMEPERRRYRRVARRHRLARRYTHRKIYDEDTAAAQSPVVDQPAATEAQAPDTAANTPAASDQSNVSAMVVDGHTVQVATPDQINMMDMTAADTQTISQPAMAAAPPQVGTPASDATAAQPTRQEDQPAVQNLDRNPAQNLDQKPEATSTVAMASVAQQGEDSGTNRDLWYEKLLAMLSGAFVASSIAWIMIGSAPPRRDRTEAMLAYNPEQMRR